MKKSMLVLALLGLMGQGLVYAEGTPAGPAETAPVAKPADPVPAAKAPSVMTPVVKVEGGAAVEAEPLKYAEGKGALAEPSFEKALSVVKAHPHWAVAQVKPVDNQLVRLTLRADKSDARIELSVSKPLADSLKLKAGAKVDAAANRDMLIVFASGGNSIGFLPKPGLMGK